MFNDTVSGSPILKLVFYQLWTTELSACKGSDFKGRFIIKKSARILTDFQPIFVYQSVFMDYLR